MIKLLNEAYHITFQAASAACSIQYACGIARRRNGEAQINIEPILEKFKHGSDHYDPDYYETSPSVDPQGPTTGSHRVFRGGAYSSSQIHCRSAYRGHEPPDSKDRLPLGFRVVLVVADSR